jgi:hypothetical protein
MKITAFIIGLVGLIVSSLISVFYIIVELNGLELNIIGYSVSTILAILGIVGIILLNYKYKQISSKYSGILLLFFSGAYLLLYLVRWPFPELGLLVEADAAYFMGPAILILYAGTPLMFIGAILFLIAARKMPAKR